MGKKGKGRRAGLSFCFISFFFHFWAPHFLFKGGLHLSLRSGTTSLSYADAELALNGQSFSSNRGQPPSGFKRRVTNLVIRASFPNVLVNLRQYTTFTEVKKKERKETKLPVAVVAPASNPVAKGERERGIFGADGYFNDANGGTLFRWPTFPQQVSSWWRAAVVPGRRRPTSFPVSGLAVAYVNENDGGLHRRTRASCG